MKNLSISISGSGTISDELAADVQAVGDKLKAEAPNVYVTVGVTDVAPVEAPPAEAGQQQAP